VRHMQGAAPATEEKITHTSTVCWPCQAKNAMHLQRTRQEYCAQYGFRGRMKIQHFLQAQRGSTMSKRVKTTRAAALPMWARP
jgi:hypothetical protein